MEYPGSDATLDLINKAFHLQKPTEEQGKRLDQIREAAGMTAAVFTRLAPESPELTLALRALHQASQHCVTAVLFNEPR